MRKILNCFLVPVNFQLMGRMPRMLLKFDHSFYISNVIFLIILYKKLFSVNTFSDERVSGHKSRTHIVIESFIFFTIIAGMATVIGEVATQKQNRIFYLLKAKCLIWMPKKQS